jgi:hypothetical protein
MGKICGKRLRKKIDNMPGKARLGGRWKIGKYH